MTPITDRAGVETLLAQLCAAIRGASMAPGDAIATPAGRSDSDLARALYEQTELIPLVGRQIFLRTACCWLGDAFDALSAGRDEEAFRWAFRSAAELERYREVPQQEGASL